MQYQVAPGLINYLESVRLKVGFPVVQMDGRVVYDHVITKFLGWVDLLSYEATLERTSNVERDHGRKSQKQLPFLCPACNSWLNFRVRGHFEIAAH